MRATLSLSLKSAVVCAALALALPGAQAQEKTCASR